MKIKIKLPNWLMTIGNYIWCWWSNLRWYKATKEYPLQEKDIATQDEADKIDRFYEFLSRAANRVDEGFHYTNDGIDEFGDSMRPPAQCYKDLVEGSLKDDCDGFHSALYYIMSQKALHAPVYMASIGSRDGKRGHAILVGVDPLGGWFAQDYGATLNIVAFNQEELIKELQTHYTTRGYGEDAHVQLYTYDKKKGFRVKK